MPRRSIRTRFLATLSANAFRSVLSLVTGLIVARALGPESFGALTFLMMSWVAILDFLNLGTDQAFFTFLSQRPRGRPFAAIYIGFQIAQLGLALFVVALIFPEMLLRAVWVDQEQVRILLALLAAFLQRQMWTTMVQIGESARLTVRVQGLTMLVATAHLVLITTFWLVAVLTVELIFVLITIEYAVAALAAWKFLPADAPAKPARLDLRAMAREYAAYCAPLVLYRFVGLAYTLADRWLLQNYSGAEEQAFFAVADRVAQICLLTTTALTRILWKEVAEAHKRQSDERVRMLHRRSTRALYFIGCAFAGFLLPWSNDILRLALGQAYVGATTALMVMLLHAPFAALGRVNFTSMYATSRTGPVTVIGGASMLLSIPVTYFATATATAPVPGLDLGSLGVSLKWLVFTFLTVNVMAWYFSRQHGAPFDWTFQIVVLPLTVAGGWAAFVVSQFVLPDSSIGIPIQGILALAIHGGVIAAIVYFLPDLTGFTRAEISRHIGQIYRQARGMLRAGRR